MLEYDPTRDDFNSADALILAKARRERLLKRQRTVPSTDPCHQPRNEAAPYQRPNTRRIGFRE